MKRLYFTAWGYNDEIEIPAYSMETDLPRPETVSESIARKNGLSVCAGPRLDSWNGNESHYQMTLGKPVRSGGWNVVSEVWFAIPKG